ncbi:gamma-glutamyl hydrolase-like [Ptychodera flava]|uniref:gamma-glutamyl hydrolase-like n=1 Tax=Ptychodera flava TaxID=63121 RepID=UPI00396A4DF4
MAGKQLHFMSLAITFWLAQLCEASVNDRPIIGVMCHHTDPEKAAYGNSYISAGYVKFLESAGARVVPVRVNQTDEYYQHLFESLNGVLFTGGDVDLKTSGYAKAGKIFYDLAVKAFDNGDLFPMWGTCLGFQLFTALTSGKDLLTDTDAVHVSYPLNFQKGYESSRMFMKSEESEHITGILSTQNVTFNSHHFGITPQTFHNNVDLRNFYKVLSTNYDQKGKEFVSVIEGFKYPFYATQWHPEINPFEFSPRLGVNANHSEDAVKVTQYMANFFVGEARKSSHHFKDKAEESSALIYNYTPVYTGNFTAYEQCYFFD